MTRVKTELEIRHDAVQSTMDKYRDRDFSWGVVDCIRMSSFHARKMGHIVPKLERYRTYAGAVRALKKSGYLTIQAAFDDLFSEIPLAMALVGDFVIGEGENGMDASFIWCGRKMMGFHEEANGLVMLVPKKIKAAYRVPVRK